MGAINLVFATLLLLEAHSRAQDEPLFLTPLITQGKLQEARKAAQVTPLLPGVVSYSGFLTVDAPKCNSNMFFWFFPADKDWQNAPLTLWLAGGPCMSDLFAALYEHSPIELTEAGEIRKREYSWTRASNMLYIDNPVAAGFSFANEECYSDSDTHAITNLINALEQFFKLFDELQKNKFFVFGEGYGTRFAVVLTDLLHEKKSIIPKIEGIGLGNSLLDPIHQIKYGEPLFNMGLINKQVKEQYLVLENDYRSNITAGNHVQAAKILDQMILAKDSLFYSSTGYQHYYNYLDHGPVTRSVATMSKYVVGSGMPKKIHAGDMYFHQRDHSSRLLLDQMSISLADKFARAIENYRVMMYDGQMDLGVTYLQTVEVLSLLKWKGSEEFRAAERMFWRVNNDLVGYSKTAGNLTEILVRNAGLFVPMDQPEWAYDMFHKFINDQPFS